MSLSGWLDVFGYKHREELYLDMLCGGYSEDEFETEWEQTVDLYLAWCEEIGSEVDIDE